MISLFRFLKGYVFLYLSGFSPERFINLCNHHQIKIWNVSPCPDGYEICMAASDVYHIKDFLKKTNTKVVIRKKLGLPFFLYQYRKRKIFVIGLFTCFCLLFFTTRFIWSFEISGNRTLTKDLYMEFLKDHEITYGSKVKDIDTAYLEKEIREQYPYITWASVKLQGTKLSLTIKENQNPDFLDIQVVPGNICAATDGQISSIITRKGTPLVQKGDMIKEGDILILGEVPIFNDDETLRTKHFVQADGDIVLTYNMEYKDIQPYSVKKKLYTGRNVICFLLGYRDHQVRFPFFTPYENMDCIKTLQFMVPAYYEKIPLYFGKEQWKEYTYTEQYLNHDEAMVLLNDRFFEFCKSLNQKGIQIIRKNVKINYSATEASVLVDLTLETAGGRFVPITQ